MDQDHLDSHDLALLLAQFRSAMAEVLRVSRRSVDILRVVDLRIAFRLKYLLSWIPRHRIPVHIEEELSTTGGPVFKLIGGSLKVCACVRNRLTFNGNADLDLPGQYPSV